MTKYRFTRGPHGRITVRAERIVGKRLVTSITRTILPGEDVSAAMMDLHREVQAAPLVPIPVGGMASEPGVGE